MCKFLGVSRANFYRYQAKEEIPDAENDRICRIFRDNRQAYGTRRLKVACEREGVILSRRRIARFMRYNGLGSVYTKAHYKIHKSIPNESPVSNALARKFDERDPFEVIVSDLTYVRVNRKWHYVCTLMDLHNRKIIGYSTGAHKTAELVIKAFASVKTSLSDIKMFHTDRGKEFVNHTLEKLIDTFDISLSNSGVPHDNAVAEATFKSIKTKVCSCIQV